MVSKKTYRFQQSLAAGLGRRVPVPSLEHAKWKLQTTGVKAAVVREG